MKVATRIDIRKKLLDLGYTNLAEYCRDRGIRYNDAIYLLKGITTGERSERVRKAREIIAKDFGEDVFPDFGY